MRSGRTLSAMLIIAALALFSVASFAEGPQQPSPEEMQKMMEQWQKISTPGAPHAALAKMAGNWTYKMKMWMDPKAPPSESEGTSKGTMLLDGRYLQTDNQGNMMGMPFHGIGTMGYDRGRADPQHLARGAAQ